MIIEIIAGKITKEELFDLRWLYIPSLAPRQCLSPSVGHHVRCSLLLSDFTSNSMECFDKFYYRFPNIECI